MTTDERLASVLRGHYAREPVERAERERMTQVALREIGSTRQGRRRRWPFPVDPVTTRSSRFPGREPTPAPSGHSPARGSTLFSAVRFVAAAAIVALFGGFLLAGVLIRPPGDEVVPAAVTDSPSPMTTEGLLSGMLTEEVEPGVLRVVNDGVRDLMIPDAGTPNSWLAVGPAGSVWVFGEVAAFQLAEEARYNWYDHTPWAYELAPDGTLWGLTSDSTITSFDGQSWTAQGTPDAGTYVDAMAAAPDGTIWATAGDDLECPEDTSTPCFRRRVLLRVDETGLSAEPGWEEVHAGGLAWHRPVIGPDGSVWLVGLEDGDRSSPDGFLRYDGTDWHVIDGPEGQSIASTGASFGFASDGTLWTAVALAAADGHAPNDSLARLDESGWKVFSEADGIQPWGRQHWYATDYLRIAPDGKVWVNATTSLESCDGVASFDGTTWTPYLRGHCVDDFEIAPDGSGWVLASADHDGPVHAYVITPEATRTSRK